MNRTGFEVVAVVLVLVVVDGAKVVEVTTTEVDLGGAEELGAAEEVGTTGAAEEVG